MATWIKVDENIILHHKTAGLRQILGLKRQRDAVGYVVMLWIFTLKVAWRDGDLTRYGSDLIENACEWDGDPGHLFKALQKSGFIDGFIVHDWVLQSTRLIRDRLYYEGKQNGSGGEMSEAQKEILKIWNDFGETHKLSRAVKVPILATTMSPEKFKLILEEAEKQPYLLGETPDSWRMTLPWILKQENIDKVCRHEYRKFEDPKAEAEAAETDQFEKDRLAAKAEMKKRDDFMRRRKLGRYAEKEVK